MTITVLWSDGCEDYATLVNSRIDTQMTNGQRWILANYVRLSTNARTGAYSFELDVISQLRRSLRGSWASVGIAWSMDYTTFPTRLNGQWPMMSFRNEYNKTICSVTVGPTGKIVILDKSGLPVASSTREVAAGRHNHFEARINVATGIKVTVNGKFSVEYLGVLQSGNETEFQATRPAESIALGNTNNGASSFTKSVYMDDVIAYTYDDADPLIGQQGVYYLKPDADGADTDWGLSTGINGYALIDTIAPVGDASFIFADVSGKKSSFSVEPLPDNILSVLAVQPTVFARTTDSGEGRLDLGVISAGTEQMGGDDFAIQSDYGYNDIAPVMLDPDTSEAWNPLFMPDIIVERTI